MRQMSAATLRYCMQAVLLLTLLPALTSRANTDFPHPTELQPDVDFWVRVYTEIETSSGFVHDADNLAVVYDTLHLSGQRRADEKAMRKAGHTTPAYWSAWRASPPARAKMRAQKRARYWHCGGPMQHRPDCARQLQMCASSAGSRNDSWLGWSGQDYGRTISRQSFPPAIFHLGSPPCRT